MANISYKTVSPFVTQAWNLVRKITPSRKGTAKSFFSDPVCAAMQDAVTLFIADQGGDFTFTDYIKEFSPAESNWLPVITSSAREWTSPYFRPRHAAGQRPLISAVIDEARLPGRDDLIPVTDVKFEMSKSDERLLSDTQSWINNHNEPPIILENVNGEPRPVNHLPLTALSGRSDLNIVRVAGAPAPATGTGRPDDVFGVGGTIQKVLEANNIALGDKIVLEIRDAVLAKIEITSTGRKDRDENLTQESNRESSENDQQGAQRPFSALYTPANAVVGQQRGYKTVATFGQAAMSHLSAWFGAESRITESSSPVTIKSHLGPAAIGLAEALSRLKYSKHLYDFMGLLMIDLAMRKRGSQITCDEYPVLVAQISKTFSEKEADITNSIDKALDAMYGILFG